MPPLQCPEIELRHSPSSWEPFTPRHASPELDTSIDLLELRARDVKSLSDSGATYKRGLNHLDLVQHMTGTQDVKKRQDPLFRILFVNGHLSRPQDLTDFNDVRPSISSETADFLQEHLGVSPSFLALMIRKSWDLKSGNCQWVKAIPGETGEDSVVEGWYRYSCGLKSYPSYVWYSYTSNCTTYLLNNSEYNGVQDAIVRCVEAGMANSLLRPLAVDGFIAEATSEGWGEAMRSPRWTLIKYEQFDEQNMFVDTRESVKELHVLSYNLLIIKEDMTDHIDRLEYLLDVHKTLESICGTAPPQHGIKLTQSLSFLLSETRIRQRWVECYANRTGIQINLWYNLSSQRDNKTNLKIADFTSKIATETQKDSSSMITMAAVTMAFLPGTFVSALFSMVFFDTSTSPDGRVSLSVGPSWWLFPAITIPLTILVFAIWHIWRTRRNVRQMHELMKMEETHDTPEKKGPAEWASGYYASVPNSVAPSIAPSLNSPIFVPNTQNRVPDWYTQPSLAYQVPIPLDTYSMARTKPTPAGTPFLLNAHSKRSEVEPGAAFEKAQMASSPEGATKKNSKAALGEPLISSWSGPPHPSPWYTPPPAFSTPPYNPENDTLCTPRTGSPTIGPWSTPFLPQPSHALDTYSMAKRQPVTTVKEREALRKLGGGHMSPPSTASGPLSVDPDPARTTEARAAERRNRERFYIRNAALTLEDLHEDRNHRKQAE